VFNELVDRLSRDKEYLNKALGEVSKSDEFTGRLLKMYNEVYPSGVSASAQPVALGLHRSDYMIDDSSAAAAAGAGAGAGAKKRLLQVELNTIASSFGCLASVTADLHRYLLERFFLPSLALQPSSSSSSDELQAFLASYLHNHGLVLPPSTSPSAAAISNLPPNPTLTQLPSALAAAHSYYNNPEAIIVFIVQPGERNLFDQRFLELALWEKYQKQVVRLSLEEVTQRCLLKKEALFLDGKHEVAVVYFRAGYTPVDYPSEKAWEARMMIERSAAVKCPTLGYQLAGTKKVQQLLCEPLALGRFLSKEQCVVAQKHFTGLYGLGQEEMKEEGGLSATAVRAAIANPQAYVLKPQREGGGNNFYDDELKKALETWSPEKLSGHVLMQRIQAPARNAYLMREGKVVMGPAVSELGIFSTFLGDTSATAGGEGKGGVQVNEYAGFNVRTKLATVNEGGVATGFAVLDSPMLVDE
jgi:glutathione synthase